MKHLIALLLVMSLSSCAIRSTSHFQAGNKLQITLQKEKDKLRSQSDPVQRTRSQIKISEILLTMTSDAVKTGDLKIVERHIDDYLSAVRDAHQTMMKTGRDAHKKPKGFRELEISLRRQVNQLKDIGGALSYDERDPVEKAREEAARMRDELLKALFGSQDVTPS